MIKSLLNDSCLNSSELFRIWDGKYANRNQTNQVFSGNVDNYEYKRLQQSEFIVLNNPSRITKKVNKITHQAQLQPNKTQLQLNKAQLQLNKPKLTMHQTLFLERNQKEFCFQKINPQEVILYLSQEMELIKVEEGKHLLFKNQETNIAQNTDVHAIIVNKVPICPYHCLFVPWINGREVEKEGIVKIKKLEQRMTVEALGLGLRLLDMYDDLVVGFNSVGAAASVNNLHLQMFFKQFWIGEQEMPVINMLEGKGIQRRGILNGKQMKVESFWTDFIQGFIVDLSQTHGAEQIKESQKIIRRMIEENIAHNLVMMRQGGQKKVWIFVRRFQTEQTRLGCMEYSGVFCMDFETTTREDIQSKYREMKLDREVFEKINDVLLKTFQSQQ